MMTVIVWFAVYYFDSLNKFGIDYETCYWRKYVFQDGVDRMEDTDP